MTSRIYQIMPDPIAVEKYLSESDYYEDSFVGSVADSVDEHLDRERELNEIGEYLSKALKAKFDYETASFIIPKSGKKSYFKVAYKKFSETAVKLSAVDFEMFVQAQGISKLLYDLNESYSETFERYVKQDDCETETFNDFVHYAQPGIRYYIGGILSYHY